MYRRQLFQSIGIKALDSHTFPIQFPLSNLELDPARELLARYKRFDDASYESLLMYVDEGFEPHARWKWFESTENLRMADVGITVDWSGG